MLSVQFGAQQVKDLILFLEKLEQKKIHYQLEKYRTNAITVVVSVPGERWEIDFVSYNYEQNPTDEIQIEIERFKSDGSILDETELDFLFDQFSD